MRIAGAKIAFDMHCARSGRDENFLRIGAILVLPLHIPTKQGGHIAAVIFVQTRYLLSSEIDLVGGESVRVVFRCDPVRNRSVHVRVREVEKLVDCFANFGFVGVYGNRFLFHFWFLFNHFKKVFRKFLHQFNEVLDCVVFCGEKSPYGPAVACILGQLVVDAFPVKRHFLYADDPVFGIDALDHDMLRAVRARQFFIVGVADFELDVLGIAVKIVLDGVDKCGCGEIEVVDFLFAGNVVCCCVFAHA